MEIAAFSLRSGGSASAMVARQSDLLYEYCGCATSASQERDRGPSSAGIRSTFLIPELYLCAYNGTSLSHYFSTVQHRAASPPSSKGDYRDPTRNFRRALFRNSRVARRNKGILSIVSRALLFYASRVPPIAHKCFSFYVSV